MNRDRQFRGTRTEACRSCSSDPLLSLRRVKYRDAATGKTFNFLANNFAIPAETGADLYRCRWQVELFFKGNYVRV